MKKLFKVIGVSFFACTMIMSVNTMASENAVTVDTNVTIDTYTTNRMKDHYTGKTSPEEMPDYYSMIDNRGEASTINDPISLRATEELSDAVVKATFLGVTRQAELRNATFGYLIYGITCSSIRVDEVYSGDLNVGDTLNLIEPYFITESGGQSVLNHFENYYPSEIGASYIWLLTKSSGSEHDQQFALDPNQTYYSLAWCERGRYPVISADSRSAVDITSMSNEDLDLSPSGDSSIYKKIYNEVIDKYLKK